jgi:hypothetical protein
MLARVNRRELLGGLGLSALAWAFGCGGRRSDVGFARAGGADDVAPRLRDAVARLAASFPTVHALAVARRRTTAAIDVIGEALAHDRREAAIFIVQQRGIRREVATHDLGDAGIAAAVRSLVGPSTARATLASPPPPTAAPLPAIGDAAVIDRADEIARFEPPDSRVVYAAALVDVDDATVWSIGNDHDREQRLVRIREQVVRAAWQGARPIGGEITRAWRGELGRLTPADARRATRYALEIMTPGAFEAGRRVVLVDPSVAAQLVDAAGRILFAARRRPERARFGSELVSLFDDPSVPNAYGGFAFDDAGLPAERVKLVEAGRFVAPLERGRTRRPGHVGLPDLSPSHLVLARGTVPYEALQDATLVLEGGTGVVVDPRGWVIAGCARARELQDGKATGRLWADVELAGDLGDLFAAVSGVSSETTSFGFRDERASEPIWRSVEVPWVRLEAHVRPRRGPA